MVRLPRRIARRSPHINWGRSRCAEAPGQIAPTPRKYREEKTFDPAPPNSQNYSPAPPRSEPSPKPTFRPQTQVSRKMFSSSLRKVCTVTSKERTTTASGASPGLDFLRRSLARYQQTCFGTEDLKVCKLPHHLNSDLLNTRSALEKTEIRSPGFQNPYSRFRIIPFVGFVRGAYSTQSTYMQANIIWLADCYSIYQRAPKISCPRKFLSRTRQLRARSTG